MKYYIFLVILGLTSGQDLKFPEDIKIPNCTFNYEKLLCENGCLHRNGHCEKLHKGEFDLANSYCPPYHCYDYIGKGCYSCPAPDAYLKDDSSAAHSNASGWMHKLASITEKQLTLKDIVLPGIHRAGIVFSAVTGDNFLKPWIAAQERNIFEQLQIGVRFFDIHIAAAESMDGSDPMIVTASALLGSWDPVKVIGMPLFRFLEDTIKFLQNHPGETIVWKLHWEFGWRKWDLAIKALQQQTKFIIKGKPLSATEVLLADVAGKLIICDNGFLGEFGSLVCDSSFKVTKTFFPEKLVAHLFNWECPENSFAIADAICSPHSEIVTLHSHFLGYASLHDLSTVCNEAIITKFFTKFTTLSAVKKFVHSYDAISMYFAAPSLIKQVINFNFDLHYSPKLTLKYFDAPSSLRHNDVVLKFPDELSDNFCIVGVTNDVGYRLMNGKIAALRIDSDAVYTAENVTVDDTFIFADCGVGYIPLGIMSNKSHSSLHSKLCCIKESYLTLGQWHRVSEKRKLYINLPLNSGYGLNAPVISEVKDFKKSVPYVIRRSMIKDNWSNGSILVHLNIFSIISLLLFNGLVVDY